MARTGATPGAETGGLPGAPTGAPPARRSRAAALAVLLLAACGGDGGGERTAHPLDDVLRVTDLQMEGTHNSSHLRPLDPLFAAIAPLVGWAYDMPPLYEQLDRHGVRSVEIDVHWSPGEGRFAVYHLPILDPRVTCGWLAECLGELERWSREHPGHHPLVVLVEPKDELDPFAPIAGHYQDLDAEILSVWPRERVLTPDDVQGARATLAEAVRLDGWPTLAEARGKAIFAMLDGGAHKDAYSRGATSLAGRVLFVDAEPDEPVAAFNSGGDPSDPRFAGMLLRKLSAGADDPPAERPGRVAAHLAAGYHVVSTDFPSAELTPEFWVEVPGGTPSGCNPRSEVPGCTALAVEDPARLGG